MSRTRLTEEDRYQILEYFDTLLPCTEVAEAFGVSHTTIQNVWLTEYSKDDLKERRSRLMKQYRGDKHHAYQGGITHLSSGYKLMQAPAWYEGYRDKRGRSLEHIVKYCEYNNLTKVPEGFHVHHRNEDKSDSSIENLVLLSNSEHSATHAMRRIRDYQGRFA